MLRYIIILIVTLSLFSCRKGLDKGATKEPQIKDLGVKGNPFNFSDTASKVLLTFTLLDLDKDLGGEGQNADSAVILREYRTDTLYRELYMRLPVIPREVLEDDYLEAIVTIPLLGAFYIPRLDSMHLLPRKDTLYFEIQVQDESGNKSNILKTEELHIEG